MRREDKAKRPEITISMADLERLEGLLGELRAGAPEIAEGLRSELDRARIVEPLLADYHGAKFALAPGLTAGPSMLRALNGLRGMRFRRNGPKSWLGTCRSPTTSARIGCGR